jgi:CelD/BcsL family acetyltransferase involved in cellulose biosynthesis
MTVTAGRDELTLRILRDEVAWDATRPDWDALHAACPGAATALSFAWLRTWWSVYGGEYGRDGLRILVAWRGGSLVAALPLYVGVASAARVRIRSLRFVSTGEAEHEEVCPDYLDVLSRPGDGPEVAVEVWREIARETWDRIEWLDMPATSPLLHLAVLPAGSEVLSRGACPVADLTDGFDAYLGRLSANGRQQARRLMREGERAGARFEIAGEREVDGAFGDLRRLHQARWAEDGKPGVFAAPRFVAFHRELVRQWLPSGRAVLATLSLDGEPVAVLYGFVTAGTFDFYQSGVRMDQGGPLRSPGNLAHLLLMQALSARGVTAYDFLRGASAYKARLATRERAIAGIRIWRSTPRAIAARTVQAVARGFRGAARRRGGGA